MPEAEISGVQPLPPFTFGWPDAVEHFEGGWDYYLDLAGARHRVRHGLGGRTVYGRQRVHTVTWLGGEVQVEGVEADDYPATRSLLSVLRRDTKHLVRNPDEVPAGYEDFDLVDHRREIDAKWSRYCIAVKIREDDLTAWARHPWLRMRQRQPGTATLPTRPSLTAPAVLPEPPPADARAVADPADKNDVFVIHRFPTLQAAQGYAGSTELKEAMGRAGVAGPPRIEIAVEA